MIDLIKTDKGLELVPMISKPSKTPRASMKP